MQYNKHLFVHIGHANHSYSDPLLESVDIRQIYDKFPEKKGGLKELFGKGPQNAFFLVKFWVSKQSDFTGSCERASERASEVQYSQLWFYTDWVGGLFMRWLRGGCSQCKTRDTAPFLLQFTPLSRVTLDFDWSIEPGVRMRVELCASRCSKCQRR